LLSNNEGSKNEVRKIRFEGNNSFPAPELRKHMKTKEKGIFSWITKSGLVAPSRIVPVASFCGSPDGCPIT
jgi:outer membrane protein insertion porin family